MNSIDKRDLSETEICDRYISPALAKADWKIGQIRREFSFTDGQMIVRGRLSTRGERKRADYLLYHQTNQPIAVIEAKDNNHSLGAGMQQALDYARILDVPFVFSSNAGGTVAALSAVEVAGRGFISVVEFDLLLRSGWERASLLSAVGGESDDRGDREGPEAVLTGDGDGSREDL
jgi:type I site-specific restriction endonuclease